MSLIIRIDVKCECQIFVNQLTEWPSSVCKGVRLFFVICIIAPFKAIDHDRPQEMIATCMGIPWMLYL